jgi:hypothetical protein
MRNNCMRDSARFKFLQDISAQRTNLSTLQLCESVRLESDEMLKIMRSYR